MQQASNEPIEKGETARTNTAHACRAHIARSPGHRLVRRRPWRGRRGRRLARPSVRRRTEPAGGPDPARLICIDRLVGRRRRTG
jgi:hypothetical protein